MPTGIDRVCLAYLDHFQGRSRAMIQRKGLRVVLSDKASDRLFELIAKGRAASPLDWVSLGLSLLPGALRSRVPAGALYLNVGHTGLENPTLGEWIAANRLQAIFLIHDLIPLTHPQYCRDGEAEKHARRMRTVLSSASGIVGNSIATLAELKQFAAVEGLKVPPLHAVPIAGHQAKRAATRIPADKPYFVSLGTIEGRKNHRLLLNVWGQLAKKLGPTAPILRIIGHRGWQAAEVIRQLDNLGPLEGLVLEQGSCDDEELARLLGGARALLMPSFAEGFGLPVVEALQMSVPVIASDLSVYKEVAGEIPTYLSPHDETGWENAIIDFLTDCAERRRQLQQMAAYRAPTWTDHFRQFDAWLRTLREKDRPSDVRTNYLIELS